MGETVGAFGDFGKFAEINPAEDLAINVDAVAGEVAHPAGGHLRAAGVLDAEKEHGGGGDLRAALERSLPYASIKIESNRN